VPANSSSSPLPVSAVQVTFFGDSVRPDRTARSMELAGSCDLLLAVGSSLMVWSAYRYVRARDGRAGGGGAAPRLHCRLTFPPEPLHAPHAATSSSCLARLLQRPSPSTPETPPCPLPPPPRLAKAAKDAGAKIALVCVGETRADPIADWKAEALAGEVLARLASHPRLLLPRI
jgi:hypothetical protein